jgi:hypothetical protein
LASCYRVRELEDQLADRERLIESLEVLRVEQQVDSTTENNNMNNSLSQSSEAMVQFKKSLSDSISNLSGVAGGSGGPTDNGSQAADIGGKSAHPVVVLADDAVDTSLPRVINLNQDPLFSECLVYYLPEGTVVAGSKGAQSDILLSGPDIIDRHCMLNQDGGHVWLLPFAGSLVFVNGDLVQSATQSEITSFTNASFGEKRYKKVGRQLQHFDRIAFGRFHLFRFEASGQLTVTASPARGLSRSSSKPSRASSDSVPPGWEFAQEELLRKNENIMSLRSSSENLTLSHPSDSSYSSPHTSRIGYNASAQSLLNGKGSVSASKRSSSPMSSSDMGSLSMPKQSSSPIHHRPAHGDAKQQMLQTSTLAQATALQTPVIPSQQYRSAPAVADTAAAVSTNAVDVGSERDMWERLSKIADGSTQARPNEIKDMLRNLMDRTESRINPGSAVSTNTTQSSSTYALQPPQQTSSTSSAQSGLKNGIQNAVRVSSQIAVSPKYSPAFEVKSPPGTMNSTAPDAGNNTHSNGKSLAGSPPPPPPPPHPVNSIHLVNTTSNSASRSSSAADSINNNGLSPHEVFAKEALALQEELAGMQKTLEERMQRYQRLVSSGMPAK